MVWISQVTCGIWFGGGVTYFSEHGPRIVLTSVVEQAGLSDSKAFDFGVGISALGWVSTCASWYLMTKVGRRTLFVGGMATLFTTLVVIGFLGIPELTSAIGYTQGGLMLFYVLTYDLTVGPVVYTLVSEIPSSRLRIKTVAVARNAYNIASICANELNAPILNPLAWNLRGKGAFVWIGFCLASTVWAYFRLPEPKGLSFEEIDVLFENKTPARKFHSRVVDLYGSGEGEAAVAST